MAGDPGDDRPRDRTTSDDDRGLVTPQMSGAGTLDEKRRDMLLGRSLLIFWLLTILGLVIATVVYVVTEL